MFLTASSRLGWLRVLVFGREEGTQQFKNPCEQFLVGLVDFFLLKDNT